MNAAITATAASALLVFSLAAIRGEGHRGLTTEPVFPPSDSIESVRTACGGSTGAAGLLLIPWASSLLVVRCADPFDEPR